MSERQTDSYGTGQSEHINDTSEVFSLEPLGWRGREEEEERGYGRRMRKRGGWGGGVIWGRWLDCWRSEWLGVKDGRAKGAQLTWWIGVSWWGSSASGPVLAGFGTLTPRLRYTTVLMTDSKWLMWSRMARGTNVWLGFGSGREWDPSLLHAMNSQLRY